MEKGYVLLLENEEMWVKMMVQVLEDNGIPCVTVPVYGAGLTIKAGLQERRKLFVPAEHQSRARDLVQEFFSTETVRKGS